jgi:orotate phosphoribosyltransferase
MAPDGAIGRELRAAVAATQGHFRYESGDHGDLWLDLDALFVDAIRMRRWAAALAVEAASCGAVVAGRRVLLVDDAINAGSAVGLTLAELLRHGGVPAGIACLLTLGEAAGRIAREHGVPLVRLATLDRGMWPPETCPLCAAGMPLTEAG